MKFKWIRKIVPQAFFPRNILLTTERNMKQLKSKNKSSKSTDTEVANCWPVLLTLIWTVTAVEGSVAFHPGASWEREQHRIKQSIHTTSIPGGSRHRPVDPKEQQQAITQIKWSLSRVFSNDLQWWEKSAITFSSTEGAKDWGGHIGSSGGSPSSSGSMVQNWLEPQMWSHHCVTKKGR